MIQKFVQTHVDVLKFKLTWDWVPFSPLSQSSFQEGENLLLLVFKQIFLRLHSL